MNVISGPGKVYALIFSSVFLLWPLFHKTFKALFFFSLHGENSYSFRNVNYQILLNSVSFPALRGP